ncbi:MAG: hypothetical protein ACD_79C01249G0001, partial [uncultured bacterium]
MEINTIIIFAISIIILLIIIWFLFSIKNKLSNVSAGELAVLNERLTNKDMQLEDYQSKVIKYELEISSLQKNVNEESVKRASAEEKNQRIILLDNELKIKDQKINELQKINSELQAKISEYKTVIEEERKSAQERLTVFEEAKKNLLDTFKALSSNALKDNNASFLQLAKTELEKVQQSAKGDLELRQKTIEGIVKPIKESLDKVDGKIHELEKMRLSAYATLTEQVKSLSSTQNKLQSETANLVKALRTPNVRGRWGEIQLKRVVEIAGMVNYCDFYEQPSTQTDEKRLIRPDMIIRLPSCKEIV